MKDNMTMGISGKIKITQGNNILYNQKNTITINALEILLKSMSSGISSNFIDNIKLTGSFGNIDKVITEAEVNLVNKNITFRTRVLAADFTGTLTDLELIMSEGNLVLATKTGISVYKDNLSEIIIEWEITLNIL